MKPTSMLEKYKKKESARVKSGFKLKNGADKLDRQLSEYTYSSNEENEMEFLRFIKDLTKRGLIEGVELKIFQNKAMMRFNVKHKIVQYLIDRKKQELGIFNKLIVLDGGGD